MPPKRKAASDGDSGSDYEEEPPVEDSEVEEEEEEAKPKPKRKAPAKKKATPKKQAADDGEPGSSAKKKPAAKRVKPPTEITLLDDGWTLHPPSLIYKLNPSAQGGAKIAAFDLDGTLVGTKSGRDFGVQPDDWRWFNQKVPQKLIELQQDGYQLVIFSNQGSIKKALNGKASENVRGRVDNMLADLNKHANFEVPVQVFIATDKDNYRKPATGMWQWFVKNANKGVEPDLKSSFYVGDAAGRQTDINDGASSDKDFAAGVGIEFFLPEDKFGESNLNKTVGSGDSSGKNVAMATAFRQLADLLKAEPFKANAFKKVADIIDEFPDTITAAKQLTGIKGVGKSSLAKITEFLETGTLGALKDAGIGGGAGPVDKEAEVGLKFL